MSSGLALPVLAQRVDKRDTPKDDPEVLREDVRHVTRFTLDPDRSHTRAIFADTLEAG